MPGVSFVVKESAVIEGMIVFLSLLVVRPRGKTCMQEKGKLCRPDQ
jgi:hypothetical protein